MKTLKLNYRLVVVGAIALFTTAVATAAHSQHGSAAPVAPTPETTVARPAIGSPRGLATSPGTVAPAGTATSGMAHCKTEKKGCCPMPCGK